MSGGYDPRAGARKDADLIVTDLAGICGMLEEAATLWRRAGLFGRQAPGSSPGSIQAAARTLADTVRALPDADRGQHQALVFSAVIQLAALEESVVLAAAVPGSSRPVGGQLWTAIQDSLDPAGKQLWSLICHLAQTGETSCSEAPESSLDSEEARRALAMQAEAIDALPEAELRRLLKLIGGMDPTALQQAAAAYTEMFSAVLGMKTSVAALRSLAVAAPRTIRKIPDRNARLSVFLQQIVRPHLPAGRAMLTEPARQSYTLRAGSRALLAVQNPAPASGSQVTAGGDRWLVTAVRGQDIWGTCLERARNA